MNLENGPMITAFQMLVFGFCLARLADKREDRGVYRRVPVRIMGAKHESVQPYLIQTQMEKLLEQYRNSTEHIIPRLARFHIEFEGIHPFIEENGCVLNPIVDSTDPGQYSLSTYEKPTDVKRFAGVISDMKIPYQIVIGETNPRHGLVQRTKERTKKRTSHVDWWLYKDASPYDEFEMIDNFEEHLQNYIKKRDEKK